MHCCSKILCIFIYHFFFSKISHFIYTSRIHSTHNLEWTQYCTFVRWIIIWKLILWECLIALFWMVTNQTFQDISQAHICNFSLSIYQWVMCWHKNQFFSHLLPQSSPKVSNKSGVFIWYNTPWKSMQSQNLFEKHICSINCNPFS